MTTYPPRHGTGPTATRHWAVACLASARVLRAQGHPGDATDLEDAADLQGDPDLDDDPDLEDTTDREGAAVDARTGLLTQDAEGRHHPPDPAMSDTAPGHEKDNDGPASVDTTGQVPS